MRFIEKRSTGHKQKRQTVRMTVLIMNIILIIWRMPQETKGRLLITTLWYALLSYDREYVRIYQDLRPHYDDDLCVYQEPF